MQLKFYIPLLLTVAGASLVVAGCFLPIMTVAGNTYTFFDSLPVSIHDAPKDALKYNAAAFIVLALTSVVLLLSSKPKLTAIIGITSGILLTCTYYGIQHKIASIKEDTNKELADTIGGMFKQFTDSLFALVELGGKGWYVIGTGSGIIFLAAVLAIILKSKTNPQ